MTDARNTSRRTSAPYDVGYGKPPRHTQFRKGQSGNPGGRPRRPPSANELLLGEAYRQVTVKVAGRAVTMPAIQAAMRSQLQLAAGGNVHAQRAVLAAVQAAQREEDDKAEEAAEKAQEAEEAAAEAARTMRREALEQARRELRAEVRAEMEAQVTAHAVRDVEAALRAVGGPAWDKRPEEMTMAEAAAQVSFLLGLDKRSDKARAGRAGEETAERDPVEDDPAARDAGAADPAAGGSAARESAARHAAAAQSAQRNAVPPPERQTAPAVPPAPPADPPAAPPARWRDPPVRDRYARHPGRDALPTAPSRDARFTAAGIPC